MFRRFLYLKEKDYLKLFTIKELFLMAIKQNEKWRYIEADNKNLEDDIKFLLKLKADIIRKLKLREWEYVENRKECFWIQNSVKRFWI